MSIREPHPFSHSRSAALLCCSENPDIIDLFSYIAIQNFSSSPNTGCACAGDTLTYDCTAVGLGNTLWEGSVFVCAGNSIVLLHTQYGGGGTSGVCNGGEVTARSIEVNNNCYTSRLSIRVSPSFNNKTIKCTYVSTMGIETIGLSSLTVLEGQWLLHCMEKLRREVGMHSGVKGTRTVTDKCCLFFYISW